MARRPSLKPQLNQIRTWVGEGVTDIWIAHQLERTPAEVADFRRKHGLLRPDDPAPAPSPRKAATPRAAAPKERAAKPKAAPKPAPKPAPNPAAEAPAAGDEEPAKRRRRGRRGGRGRGRARAEANAVLEHGADGLLIRIDAAALDNGAYRDHWAGVGAGTATITATGIAIAPAHPAAADDDAAGGDEG